MFKEKMELRLRMAVLPFTELTFRKNNHITNIGQCETSHDHRTYFKNKLMTDILPILYRNNRITQLDEVELMAERSFPYQEIRRITIQGTRPDLFMIERLNQLSRLFLTHRNGKISLKYWETLDYLKKESMLFEAYKDVQKVALWNSLNRIFCIEPIVMMYLLNNDMDDEIYLNAYYSYVHLPDTQLDQVLDKGVAETHLHFSAGGHFYMNWQKMMSPRRSELKQLFKAKFPFEVMFGRNESLACFQMAAASIRLLLALYLKETSQKNGLGKDLDFASWFESRFGVDAYINERPDSLFQLIQTFLGKSPFDEKEKAIGYLFDTHEWIKGKFRITLPELHDESEDIGLVQDIIGLVFTESLPDTPIENVFLFRSLKYIKCEQDELFSELFWQYLRVKNQHFDCVVQQNLIKGLSYFKEFYDSATDTEIADNQIDKWRFLLQHQLQNPQIKKIEVRITPGSGKSIQACKKQFARKMLNFFYAYREVLNEHKRKNGNGNAPQAGIIVHFIKQQDKNDIEKCWLNYRENEGNGETLHFKKVQENYMREMKAIRELREEIVCLSDYIVGIDAASIESFTEPWVFAPVFRKARNSDSHKLIYQKSPHRVIRNLGLTYHVGEDFRHMITGLRQVDEVIEHFQFHAGDRIGHGMVLGISPSQWVSRNRIVIFPRIEHLENLLWIWGLWKEGIQMPGFDSSYLEQNILSLADDIYGSDKDDKGSRNRSTNGLTVFMLWKAYRYKFRFEIGRPFSDSINTQQDGWDCDQRKGNIQWTEESLVRASHCKCFLQSMRYPIEIEVTKEDEKWIAFLQKVITEKVSRNGIVIETNPTSNTAIGEIEHIFDHYIYQLNGRSMYDKGHLEAEVIVTINTDDPIVFNTNISNEFAYIFYSLQEKGVPRESILRWIDRVRENGINSSFIQSRQLSYCDVIEEINGIIKSLNEYLKGN